MNKYETLFIAKPDLPEEELDTAIERLKDRIEKNEGKVAALDYWGHRKLAYVVKYRGEKLKRGFYILITYIGSGKTVEGLETDIKIMDPVFRYLTVKLEEGADPESITEVSINRRQVASPPKEKTPETSDAPASDAEASASEGPKEEPGAVDSEPEAETPAPEETQEEAPSGDADKAEPVEEAKPDSESEGPADNDDSGDSSPDSDQTESGSDETPVEDKE